MNQVDERQHGQDQPDEILMMESENKQESCSKDLIIWGEEPTRLPELGWLLQVVDVELEALGPDRLHVHTGVRKTAGYDIRRLDLSTNSTMIYNLNSNALIFR